MSTELASLLMAEQCGEKVGCSGNANSSKGLRAAMFVDEHSGGSMQVETQRCIYLSRQNL